MGEAKRRRSEAQRAFEDQPAGQRLGDGPVDEQYHAMMTATMSAVDELFNGRAGGSGRQTGIVLMVFPFDDFDGRCNYMSNGVSRQDIVVLMKEMIARFEGQPEVSGRA
jgi:hypothetical protein